MKKIKLTRETLRILSASDLCRVGAALDPSTNLNTGRPAATFLEESCLCSIRC